MISLLAGLFLGWALGSNDAVNIFGTAVTSRMLRFMTAALLASVFVVIGSVVRGPTTIETIASLSPQTLQTAVTVSVAAAMTVTFMTLIKMPISTSQAVVGAIVGQSVTLGQINYSGLIKVVICWIGTPIGAFVLALVIYRLFRFIIDKTNINVIYLDGWMRYAFVIAGCYGAYALGANNIANVVGVYYGLDPMFTTFNLALLGGTSIAIGMLTFSRRVMATVGNNLVEMNTVKSLVAVVACALTVHFYALVGVPVSSSQAIVGAVLGMGMVTRLSTLKWRILRGVITAWVATPLISAVLFCFISRYTL